MLDPGVNEATETAFNLCRNYEVTKLSGSPQSFQDMQRNNTVKELLVRKRQKWTCSPEDNNMEHGFKFAKLENFAGDASPHMWGPHAPVNPNSHTHFPPAYPESVDIILEHMQQPGFQGNVAPTAEGKMSLFHWQIQRETQRVGEVSPELLTMQDADGDTYLHIAVAKGRRALAYVLAEKMSQCGSLDMKEHNGQTALQIATATDQHLIVRDLLAHGAQFNTRDSWGRSPLHVCAEKGHFLSLQAIWRTLKGSGQPTDIEMFNYDGLTPLHTAVLYHNSVVEELRRLESPCSYMVMHLVQRKHSFVESIKTLLLMGACLATKDLKSGRTCLHMAAEEANLELMEIIFDQPHSLSIVNVKTFSGNTPLHIASSLQNHHTQVKAVTLLMRNGGEPGTRNLENELPSQLVSGGPIGQKVRQILKGNICMLK
ncbi:NF-kappa-B inhibitor zeta isoform X1 [Scophthalmus maximus]|nr:NF-kappa-B inhibitor zeta isoform X1 [Scophthalmus maximus]